MSKIDEKAPVPFSVMSGDGESFVVGEKTYTVKPMLVKHALEFASEGLSIGSQIFNLTDKKAMAKVSGYLAGYCANEAGESMDLNKIAEDNWTVVDLKQFMRKLVDISG